MIIDDLTKMPLEFKTGIRCVMLICRNKDRNKEHAEEEYKYINSIRKITQNVSEWEETILHLRSIQIESCPLARIYSSVNSRNMRLAQLHFKKMQLNADFSNLDEMNRFYTNLEKQFYSALMQPSSRNETNFLIDCDSEEMYDLYIDRIPKELVIFDYETRNGRHIITKSFNPNEIKVEYQKDTVMLIG